MLGSLDTRRSNLSDICIYSCFSILSAHTTIGCGKQGFPSVQPYLSHTFHTVNC